MNKYIITILLLCNSLSLFSVGSYIEGPTKVDPGAIIFYKAYLDGYDILTKVTWKVTNGRFRTPTGPTSLTQTIGSIGADVIWNDATEKGILSVGIGNIPLLRIEVSINSVKNMYITDFRYNGTKVTDDVINITLGQTGTLNCSVPDLEYPIYKGKITTFQWSTPKSWGGSTFVDKGTIRINYNANTGNGETIIVTPVGYGGVLGNSKTITIRRDAPAPPPFDGNIKNVTITSNKTYQHTNLYAENVIIKNGVNVVMNGYNSVRIVPGFHAELGSTVRIYNGTAPKALTRGVIEDKSMIENEMGIDKYSAKLNQNFPSPAYSITTIPCVIPENRVSAYLQLCNMMGMVVMKIPITSAGQNSIDINTTELANGIYMYSLIVDGRLVDTKRMIISN